MIKVNVSYSQHFMGEILDDEYETTIKDWSEADDIARQLKEDPRVFDIWISIADDDE